MSSHGRSTGRSSRARAGTGRSGGEPRGGRSGGARGRPRGPRREDGTDAGLARAERAQAAQLRASGPRPDPATVRDRLREVVQPVVTAAGYDLEDLTVARAGRRHLVRVVVDADGGLTLDAIADVSRAVSAALDAAEESGGEILAGEYALEVGSPGVDRPLTQPRHWRRNVGRLVRVPVRPAEPGAGDRHLAGRVLAADDAGIVLDVSGTAHELEYERLGAGRVQVEFTRVDEVTDADLEEIGDPDEQDGPDEEWEDEER